MSKLNWNRPKYVYDGITITGSNKQISKPISGHDGHKLISTFSKGPHYCKITCVTCDNKFVKWGNSEDHHKYSK